MNLAAHPELAEVGLAVRTLVSLVFLSAAVGKLRHFTAFQGVVANYRVLPEYLAVPAAYLLPPVEALLGAMLLFNRGSPWAELIAGALLLVFALAMGVNLLRGRAHIDCGCFQSAFKQTLNWKLVGRNVLLAALLAISALVLPSETRELFATVNGLLVGGVLFVILQALNILWSIVPAWRRAIPRAAGAQP
jgi:hypothetical protein